MDKYSFQNCQKIVVLSEDKTRVLLCKRKGERDYDGVYSFIGGKMEITDSTIIDGMKREKEEEVGKDCNIFLYPAYNHTTLYRKNDGSYMLLPHYLAVYKGGNINLSDEYSEYKWVKLDELPDFEPKIPNITEVIDILLKLNSVLDDKDLIKL